MYAQELADQGVRELQNNPKLEFGIGENIYISCGNEVSGEEAVNHWYDGVYITPQMCALEKLGKILPHKS
jgi:hypothetical protein